MQVQTFLCSLVFLQPPQAVQLFIRVSRDIRDQNFLYARVLYH